MWIFIFDVPRMHDDMAGEEKLLELIKSKKIILKAILC